jgi:ubiquinone/menaquinone biosynthesis C-methylase UbiE
VQEHYDRRAPDYDDCLDQSEAMLAEAHRQAPSAVYVHGDALLLPFPDVAVRSS